MNCVLIIEAYNSNAYDQPTNDRARHRYPTRFSLQNTLSIILLLILITFVQSSHGFDLVDQVQWKVSDNRKIITDITPYNFRIEYKSPCNTFKQLEETNNLIFNWCETLFDESFIRPLTHFCTVYDVSRQKRVIPLIIGGVALVATGAGVGFSFYFKNRAFEKRLRSFVDELNIIHRQVIQGIEADFHIKNALKIAGVEMNRTQLFIEAQSNNLKSDVTLATYLSYKMAEIKLILQNSTNEFGFFRLTKQFLDIVNTSLPCGDSCPLDMTTLINCNIEKTHNRLTFGIMTRTPSKNIVILKSDPFILYNRTDMRNCHIYYSGPEFLILDTVSKCILPIPDYDKAQYMAYTKTTIECSKDPFNSYNWTRQACSIEHSFDHLQLKTGLRSNLIYCFEKNITIKSREFICPEMPFKLKTDSNFKVEQFSYNTNISINVTSNNYIWSDITNKFLTHVRNPSNTSLDDYLTEVSRINIPQLNQIETHSKLTTIIVSYVGLTLIVLMVIYSAVRIYLTKRRYRNFENIRHDIAMETARYLASSLNPGLPSVPEEDINQPD